jgi:hypothetical protein
MSFALFHKNYSLYTLVSLTKIGIKSHSGFQEPDFLSDIKGRVAKVEFKTPNLRNSGAKFEKSVTFAVVNINVLWRKKIRLSHNTPT